MHKNWKAICQIPNQRLRLTLSLIDPNSDFGRDLAKCLPEYFSPTEITGPVSLSVLMTEARGYNLVEEGFDSDKINIASFSGITQRYNIPTVKFT